MKKVFGEDLVSVLLYGSCATGTNHIESDIDIALILTSRGKSSFSRDGDERSYACDRLELEMYKKLGMPVSLLVWTMERLEKEKMFGTSFARNLAEKSINLLPQGNANVGNHLSEANDADAYKKKLVEAALFESMHKIQDCMSSMEKGRWRTANYDLYYALYHAAKAALFTRGKEPAPHNETKYELSILAEQSGFGKKYIRFYEDIERLRNMSVYSYLGEVDALDEADIRKSLRKAYEWLRQTADGLIIPVLPDAMNFDSLLECVGLNKESFFIRSTCNGM